MAPSAHQSWGSSQFRFATNVNVLFSAAFESGSEAFA